MKITVKKFAPKMPENILFSFLLIFLPGVILADAAFAQDPAPGANVIIASVAWRQGDRVRQGLEATAATTPSRSTDGTEDCTNGIAKGGDPNTIAVDYSQIGCPFRRLYQYVSTIQTSSGPRADRLIRNLGIRLERTFWSPRFWAKDGLGHYVWTGNNGNFYGDDTLLDNIISQGAQPVVNIGGVPDWLENSQKLPTDMNTYQRLLEDGLKHLRDKYPRLQYIEFWSEPDCEHLSQDTVDSLYRALTDAVQAVNASRAQGQLPFLVGGPTVCHLSWGMLPGFLSFVRANNLPLNFVSYHVYGNSDPDIATEAIEAQKNLSVAGLNPDLPQMVTEWGFTYHNDAPRYDNVDNMKAATYVFRGWHSLLVHGLENIVISMPFAETDYANFNRSVLIAPKLNAGDGNVNTTYNVYAMMNMQKSTMIASSGLTGDPSLFPIATEDSSGVALMLTNNFGSKVTVNMNNLPDTFRYRPFKYQEYVVDQTHSNFAYNRDNHGTLEIVKSSTQTAASSFNMAIQMSQYSIVLIILTPT